MGEATNMRPEENVRNEPDPQAEWKSPGASVDADDDPNRIRHEIEETRAEMGETVDAIQERFAPEHLKEQAVEAVRDATLGRAKEVVSTMGERAHDMMYEAEATGSGLVDTIRRNPVPAAIAGVGIGWLWMRRSNGKGMDTRRTAPGWTPSQSRGYHQEFSEDRDASGGRLSDVREQAAEITDQARDRIDQVSNEFGGQAQDLRYRYERTMQENPLPLGLAAMGLGLMVGLLVPETSVEDRFMGETRDRVIDQAGEKAREVMEKVEHVASESAQAVTESAERQGFSTS